MILIRKGYRLHVLKPPSRRQLHTAASGRTWDVVVGIEVHAQLKSRQKLFSCAPTSSLLEQINNNVAPFDAAFPGTLPSLNWKCVELALRTAFALESHVQRRSAFDRKHYFYADLPSGYQITQQYAPLATGGHLRLSSGTLVGIKQIQLEQDTGKSAFDSRRKLSLIDLNRAGSGLIEIVSLPDLRSAEEAADYVRTLQELMRSVGSSDGNMEEGSLRCDVNVSVNPVGGVLGTRCEIKNLNSVRNLTIAIESEVKRHIGLIEDGKEVQQETRGFDENTAETFRLRSKEDAPDYRYMPDPNLPPLLLEETYLARVRDSMPDLPDKTRARLSSRGLNPRDINVLMSIDSGKEVCFDGEPGSGAVAYFEEVARDRDAKITINWILHELLGQLSLRSIVFQNNPVSAAQLGELIDLLHDRKLTNDSAKALLRHIINTGYLASPAVLAEDLALLQPKVADETAVLLGYCQAAIDSMPNEAEAVRRGNQNVLNKLLGRIMKLSRGQADAQAAKAKLGEMLRP